MKFKDYLIERSQYDYDIKLNGKVLDTIKALGPKDAHRKFYDKTEAKNRKLLDKWLKAGAKVVEK